MEKKPISELQTMTESEKRYRIYERMEDMHLAFSIGDDAEENLKRALADKWGMLVHTGGSR